MTWRNHLLLEVNSLWLLAPLPGVLTPATAGAMVAGAALGSLLPDLDSVRSTLSSFKVGAARPFAPFSWAASTAFGHRGLLHSPLFLLALAPPAAILALRGGPGFWGALWLGYASHLAGDAATKTGIPLWPGHSRRLYLLPRRLRLSTGSEAEERLVPLQAVAARALLLGRLPFR